MQDKGKKRNSVMFRVPEENRCPPWGMGKRHTPIMENTLFILYCHQIFFFPCPETGGEIPLMLQQRTAADGAHIKVKYAGRARHACKNNTSHFLCEETYR